jgi:hypothetical protein
VINLLVKIYKGLVEPFFANVVKPEKDFFLGKYYKIIN